ncbi:MAG TPA: sigma-70 family RNA polymerase sigma factor [Anaerolineales bacterium]
MRPGGHPEVLAALRDTGAFEVLTEPYRRELQVHCYRMLGSLVEAEDLVQETLLRAWKGRRTFAGRAPVRAWLYKIATNACLDELARRPRRGLPASFFEPADPFEPPGAPVLDPIWLEPYPDALLPAVRSDPAARYDEHERVRLAFLVALQQLPPRQRAILLLCDVLGYSAAEVAAMLGRSVSSVTSALYRARVTLSERGIEGERAAHAPELDNPDERRLLERYLLAWETADIEGLILLLKEDATFPMPPLPGWYRGRADIRAFVSATILQGAARGRWKLLPTRANGQPAFGLYRRQVDDPAYAAFAIQVVTLEAGLVADATTFGFPQLLRRFGLPDELPG